MQRYKKVIEQYKNKYNLILGTRVLIEIFFLILVLFQIFNVVFNFTEGHKLELFYTALTIRVTTALLLIYTIFTVKDKFLNNYHSARLIDKMNQDNNDTFLSTFELEASENKNNPFIDRQVSVCNKKAEQTLLVYPSLLERKSLVFYIFLLLGNMILFTIFSSNLSETWKAFYLNSMPKEEIDYTISFTPGDTTLVANQNVEIKILNYNSTFNYQIAVRRDEKWRSIPLDSDVYIFNKLDYSVDYILSNEHYNTKVSHIEVYEKIALNQIKVIYDYPKYTRLETEEDTLLYGNISAIEGTEVKLLITTNNAVEKAWLIYDDGQAIQGQIAGEKLVLFAFKLSRNREYSLKLVNKYGDEYLSPTKKITVFPDLKPEIAIYDYPQDGKMAKNQIIPLTIKVSDDFGLQNLKLNYELSNGKQEDSLLFASINNKIYRYPMTLNLSKYKLYPGDEIVMWASVQDNLGKKHEVESKKITLRIPTLQEIFQAIEEKEKQQEELMSQTLKESDVLQEEFEKKRRDLLKKEELEWKDKEEIKNIFSQQEELSQNVDKSIEKMQEMIQEASKNEALTQETLDKMEKIKELMEDINTSEMQELMQKMKDKMSELNREDFKKALDEMKFSMEEFNQKLEQTLKMLEQLKKNQSLEKLLGLTKDMQDMQESLLEETQKNGNSQELSQQQEAVKEKLSSLQEEMNKFKDMLNEPSDQVVKEEMNKLESEIDLSKMSQEMSKISQQMKENQSSSTQSSQKEMLSQMQKMSESLLNMQSMMSSQKSKASEEAKDLLIKELLFYAKEHKDLIVRMDADPFVIFDKMISQQEMLDKSLRKFFTIPEIMLSLNPKFMFDLANTLTAFNNFFTDVSDNKVYTAKNYMKDIQSGFNLMIFDLLQDDSSQSSGGSGGMQDFMQQMQQMGQEQMAMNMLAQQMMQELGQGKPQISNEMRGKMRQMAADENRIAENLKRLMQTNPMAQKQTNGLNKLIEELEDVSNKLRFNKMDQELLKQQENILSRMLEATKSINKKDQSKKRKGQESEDKKWDTPQDIEMRFKELEKNALLDEEYKNYSREYQKIILEYLKRINRD